MLESAYSQYFYACEAFNIDVYFEFENTVVFNTGKEIVTRDGLSPKKCSELTVITECELEKYNGPSETRRYCRRNLLVMQGIITFFTGFPLTVYDSCNSSAGINSIQYKKQETHLIIENNDYTSELIKMLERIREEPELIITLLDRWRKAVYLKKESCDADLYYDEATLSFFHIFELFGESVGKELKYKLENNIGNMMKKHFESYYFSDSQVNQMVNQNKKSINSILIGNYLNLAIKIKFFLEKHNMLDANVSCFVDNMINIRNAIAHGRITYQDKFIWPLSPFFNLAKDSYENIELLFFMTATMISKYIGISCWVEEWEEAKVYLLAPKEIVDDFLDDKLIINDFDPEMLFTGNQYNITWRTFFHTYIHKPKISLLERMEKKLKTYFIEIQIDEEKAPDIFNISLIFADSHDNQIKDKAIENIEAIIINQWYGWSNLKDAYSYLDFYHVDVKWYKYFLDSKKYLYLIQRNDME